MSAKKKKTVVPIVSQSGTWPEFKSAQSLAT